jgi:hypothetical protein
MSRTGAIGAAVRGHRAAVRGHRAPVRYVSFPESSGVSESRNRIVELAATPHLLFLDADAVPRPGWADALVRALGGGHTLVGARILPRWPRGAPWLLRSTLGSELLGNLDCGETPRPLSRVMGTSFGADLERLAAAPFAACRDSTLNSLRSNPTLWWAGGEPQAPHTDVLCSESGELRRPGGLTQPTAQA